MLDIEAEFKSAVVEQRAGHLGEAAARYRKILARSPGLIDARDNLCLALLEAGDYAKGFSLYDVRFSRSVGRVPLPALSFPMWQGEPIAGRSILIWPEQGFGDQIMFARFAPVLAAMGASVSMLVAPALAGLFATLPVTVIAARGEVAIPPHDFWIVAGSLPARLGVTVETVPSQPYLPSRPGGTGVGVAWRGDPKHPNDANRSMTQDQAARLLAIPGAISLLPEDTGARDFHDTADIISGLARVVSVDTSVAHLAGAMGKPTDILLPSAGVDWRWMRDRPDSPWYPSARLHRHGPGYGWAEMVEHVSRATYNAR